MAGGGGATPVTSVFSTLVARSARLRLVRRAPSRVSASSSNSVCVCSPIFSAVAFSASIVAEKRASRSLIALSAAPVDDRRLLRLLDFLQDTSRIESAWTSSASFDRAFTASILDFALLTVQQRHDLSVCGPGCRSWRRRLTIDRVGLRVLAQHGLEFRKGLRAADLDQRVNCSFPYPPVQSRRWRLDQVIDCAFVLGGRVEDLDRGPANLLVLVVDQRHDRIDDLGSADLGQCVAGAANVPTSRRP